MLVGRCYACQSVGGNGDYVDDVDETQTSMGRLRTCVRVCVCGLFIFYNNLDYIFSLWASASFHFLVKLWKKKTSM